MADYPLRIVVRCEAHQPYDYFVGLVLCSFMDYADVRLCRVHRHPADLILHQAKTPNQLTPKPMKTADQILKDHEDANEMHFHQVDREWIIKAMEEYARTVQLWTRPQDQMPKEGEPVLITDIEGMQVVAWLVNDMWFSENHSWWTREIQYWMPIPELPSRERTLPTD